MSKNDDDEVCIKNEEVCIKNEEVCIKNEEVCIKNEDFCIKNEEVCIKTDEFCSSLCIASEQAGLRLIQQHGLLDAVLSAINGGGSGYQPTWTLVQTLLLFLFDGHVSLAPQAETVGSDDTQQGALDR